MTFVDTLAIVPRRGPEMMKRLAAKAVSLGLGLLLVLALSRGPVSPQPATATHGGPWHVVEMVSIASDGSQGDGASSTPSLSADGRLVAFSSSASNLVAGDTNGTSDAFVHDRQTGETTRVSVSSAGEQGNCGSGAGAISADGQIVAIVSCDSNLVAGDTNDEGDVFVHDRGTGETTRVSVSSAGRQGNNYSTFPALSADGRVVAFASF